MDERATIQPGDKEIYDVYFSLNKIIISLCNAIDSISPVIENEGFNKNAFHTFKLNLSKEFSPNRDSFKGFVESLIIPFEKFDFTNKNIIDHIDLEQIINYMVKIDKYAFCIYCKEIKTKNTLKKLDCRCGICFGCHW